MGTGGNPAISLAARHAVDLRFAELLEKVRRNRPGVLTTSPLSSTRRKPGNPVNPTSRIPSK
jgi:hypothetical protein